MEASIIDAANAGLIFTISAGNNEDHAHNYSPARLGDRENIYTVSGYDINDYWYAQSNYGNPPIDYGGPAVNITSTAIGGGIITGWNGTSFAAPHIAGLLLAVPNNIVTDGRVRGDADCGGLQGICVSSDLIAVYDATPTPQQDTLTVTISGPTELQAGETGTWQASVSNGDGTYTYQWYYRNSTTGPWQPNGTDSKYYSHSWTFSQYPQLVSIKVEVDDGSGDGLDDYNIQIKDCPFPPCSLD